MNMGVCICHPTSNLTSRRSREGAEMTSAYGREQTVDYTVLYAIHGTIYGFALTV